MYIDSFLRIPFDFFTTDIDNTFSKVGSKGVFLYSYLLYSQGSNSSCTVNIKMIQTFLNRDYDKRPEVNYGKKNHKIELLKDKDTILKVLKALHNCELIKINNIDSIVNINSFIVIECNIFKNSNYIAISNKLYLDKIYKIGHIGWSILCLLSKLFNNSYGSKSCEGFANPSQEYISSVIKVNRNTISAYAELLEKLKLIKISKQGFKVVGTDGFGNEIKEYLPNNYVVKHMLQENKYYLKHDSKKKIKEKKL